MASGNVTTGHVASWGINPEHRVGMTGSMFSVSGVVVSWDEDTQNVSADEQNEVGSNIGKTIYDRRYTVNCVIQVPASAKAPPAGTRVTVDNRTFFVVSARISESNSSYRRISINMEGSAYSGNGTFLNLADGISSVTA